MHHLKTFLRVLILVNATIFSTNAAKCLTDQEDWCVFSKISTTALFTQFYPSAEAPSNVERIKFQTSRLHTLTSKICERFTNLEELDLSGVSLRKIDADAFDQCTKLRRLNLSGNQLTEIDSNLFKNSQNLEVIDLHGNYLQEVDLSLLEGLSNLMIFDVSRNRLQSFAAYKSPKLSMMHELYLQNNELTELNEHAIVQKFPNLEKLGITGNFLQCKRVEEMSQLFEEYDIATTTEDGKEVQCLSEQQYIRLPCEKRLAAIRDEWMWLKAQMLSDDEDTQEEE